MDDQTLLVRALNNTRHSYFPTYAGLRLIGAQLDDGSDDFLSNTIRRRLRSGDKWRFKPFSMYKNTTETFGHVEHEYRSCLASSPLTALTEAFILSLLADSNAFLGRKNVYSYKWPITSKSGASYQFFGDGYKARNIEISLALARPDSVAVVTDIKGFYPSVQRETIKDLLKSAVSDSQGFLRENIEGVIEFYDQLLASGPSGIPIGPASGHALGNLILSPLDSELRSAYGHNYFRYGGDIVVVCHQTQAAAVEAKIRECLENRELEINEGKTVKLTAADWHKYVSRQDIKGGDNFRDFCRDLTIYLAIHPGRAEPLKNALRQAGFSLPVGRLLALSSYSRFKYYISARGSQQSLLQKSSLLFATDKKMIERAISLKSITINGLQELLDEEPEITPNLRRWQVQRIRRIVNSLFYLRRFSEWQKDDPIFSAMPELVEQKALGQALSTSCADFILPFFGRGPAAFSELWQEHGSEEKRIFFEKIPNEPAVADSLTVLRLHGQLPEEMDDKGRLESESRIFKAANPIPPKERTVPDLSFEDEFESLRLGITGAEISELLKTRYSRQENSPLEALSLLSSEYRS